MKTEDWVSMLATGVDAIDPKRTARRHLLAITGGLLGALALTGGMLRLNPALSHIVAEPMFWVREAYCAALALLGFAAVTRLARPGIRLGFVPAGIGTVVMVMWIFAATVLLTAPRTESLASAFWHKRRCLSLPDRAGGCAAVHRDPLGPAGSCSHAATIGRRGRGIRRGIPRCAGVFIALPGARGAVSRSWYLLGMLIPTSLGAWLGPRLMRW